MQNKTIFRVIAGTFLLCAAQFTSSNLLAQSSRQPNIVLIMADDLGYSDIGAFGSEIKTPNLDKLAGEGLRMTQFYNTGRCCPSRASLMTGLYPHQAGVGDMLQDDGLKAYSTHLNFNSVTLAEVLQSAGYHTIISGKWHVGNEPEYWPTQRGFIDQYFSNGTTGHYFGISKGRQYVVNGKDVVPGNDWIRSGESEYQLYKNEDGTQWYATDAIASHAIDFVKTYRGKEKVKPFFLYLPFTAPHWPLHAFESDIAKYQGKYLGGWDSLREVRYERLKALGVVKKGWSLSEKNSNVKDWKTLSAADKRYYDRLMAVYAAMVDRLDQNIGRVVEALRQSGDLDNTLILFLADNGGCHEMVHRGDKSALPGTPESYDGYEYSWASASNTPFKWFKHWTHEGGISTPLIAWYPSLIKQPGSSEAVGYIADIMPTLVELSGATYPKKFKGHDITPTVGKSLVPVFRNHDSVGRDITWWEHEGNRALRKGDWKIVSRYDYATNTELPWELYNLREDRPESQDLSKQNASKLNELVALYQSWTIQVKAVPYKQLVESRKTKQKEDPKSAANRGGH